MCELLSANVEALLRLNQKDEVTDFRPFEVCFAAQTFGSGKTALGMHFINQLCKPEFEEYVLKRIRGQKFEDAFLQELALAKQARQSRVNLHGAKSMHTVLSRVASKADVLVNSVDASEGLVALLMTQAVQSTAALFVHFDEVGSLPVEELQALRDVVVSTWMRMNEVAQQCKDMPRIYFYLSGKGVPLLSLGGPTSTVGTKWLILDKLHAHHIRVIRAQMLRPPSNAQLDALDRAPCEWTGGAPRLLLYMLMFLHHAQLDLSTEERVSAAMDAAYDTLSRVGTVASDVFIRQGVEAQTHGFSCWFWPSWRCHAPWPPKCMSLQAVTEWRRCCAP